MKNQNDLFIVEHENGEWIDNTGDGGWSCWTTRAEAQDALDSESDCRDDQAAAYKIVRFVREEAASSPSVREKELASMDWCCHILASEGLSGWTIRGNAPDPYCWYDEKVIQIPSDASPSLFLHEVAHALYHEPEGRMKNHYHGSNWAAEYGRLIDKYMSPDAISALSAPPKTEASK